MREVLTATEASPEAPSTNQADPTGAGALPDVVRRHLEDYLAAVDDQLPGAVVGVYEVGAAALGDFRPRHDHLQLVVVADREMSSEDLRVLGRAERRLRLRGRDAEVWTSRSATLDGPHSGLDPLARMVLATSAVAVRGPRPPLAAPAPEEMQRWATTKLQALATASGSRLLLTRRAVAALVSDAVQLAQVARTGRAWSKADAGAALHDEVPSRQGRVVFDALGYREGGTTSMYWGPFERRGDTIGLVKGLVDLVAPSQFSA